jgi:hypothetical protein
MCIVDLVTGELLHRIENDCRPSTTKIVLHPIIQGLFLCSDNQFLELYDMEGGRMGTIGLPPDSETFLASGTHLVIARPHGFLILDYRP